MMANELVPIFYKCRTTSTKVEYLKTGVTGTRTLVLRSTIHCFTTALQLPCKILVQAKVIDVNKDGQYTAYTVQRARIFKRL
jgi:hypothetical protein